MSLKNYIHSLAVNGKSSFSEEDALKQTGLSKIAFSSAIRRLKKKHEIASPVNGFFLIIPAEYQTLQSLPPEQFIDDLMKHLNIPYYVGLLSAAQYYGAAHQKPQALQVIAAKHRNDIDVGRVKIMFTTKHDATKSSIYQFNTSRGFVKVAAPETIATDVVAFFQKSGGIPASFEILSDLCTHLTLESFRRAITLLNKAPILQRLGYFFELLKLEKYANVCEEKLKKHPHVRKTLLDPHEGMNGILNKRWHLIINTELELEHDT
jgi:predicted transcriptional regulator of viral defense system